VELLSPDRNCSLLLSTARVPAHPVAVIGDSVFAIVARDPAPAIPSVMSWLINAQSGDGWGSAPVNWPLGVVRGTWTIGLARGSFTQHPSALVVELGTNDAIRAVFADGTGNPALGLRILAGVAGAVSQLIAEAAPQVPCTVLVTASTHETGLFGQGLHYSDAAGKVNAIMRAKVSGAGGKSVLIADWGALSASHHRAEGAPGNWFTPGDDIHPNAAGQRALLGLIQRVVNTCPHR
jgi:lysophospholipase L1-like esterase